MKKIFKLYLFGDIVHTSDDWLILHAMKHTYKEELQKFLIIK
jgi:hypothetical protein